MKKLILEYLANFISRWELANDYQIDWLIKEYEAFTSGYNKLPNLPADELKRVIENGEVVVSEQEEEEEVDLFKQIDTLPQEVQDILDYFCGQTGYGSLDALLEELKPHGYTFDYGLDAVPHSLRKIEQYDMKALSSPAVAKEKWMNKLEESKTQPRKFQPHDTPWDFVEEYYPNYSSSDEICEANDLNLILELQNSIMDEEGTDLHQRYISEFDGQICAVMNRHDQLMKEIYEQAIENFINSQNK